MSCANQYARDHAPTPFVVYHSLWNIMNRSFEREITLMARSEGISSGLCSQFRHLPLGMRLQVEGYEQTKKKRNGVNTGERGRMILETPVNAQRKKNLCAKLSEKWPQSWDQADKIRYSQLADIFAVALAYLLQKIRSKSRAHMLTNIKALDITLTNEHISNSWRVLWSSIQLSPRLSL
ncbi:hypothetical protein CVT25_014993 [Psilocybe cyanescens]|uniref:Uncharacterized protein n=1 Tax=Psilocybe cyanescens TaxID=93625 RepID=A0A409XI83_PSICY|nr:hypothetical protein CVT25_014993 [Psilocybe cyanescens]